MSSGTGPLNVVLVDEELPYPPTSGKRLRSLNLALRLSKRHRLTILCHRNADANEADAARAYFAGQGVATVLVERKVPPRSGPRFYARVAGNLFSPLPYSVASNNSKALADAVRAHERAHPVDLWQCEGTTTARTVGRVVRGPWVLHTQNVESLIWERYRANTTGRLKRWFLAEQARKYARFERWAVRSAGCTVAVSDADAVRFRDRFGASRVRVVENGVDTDYFLPTDGKRDPERVLFVGSLDWRPNQDAVLQLLDRVAPELHAARPDARLCIVGRRPPPWLVRRVSEVPGAELHADVGDVRPFLTGSAVLVVPLRIGGGSRLKILEALACGLPVVSTRVGAEGLHLDDGRHIRLADDVAGLAPLLAEILADPTWAITLAEAGRRRVLQRYDWNPLADGMEQVWLDLVGKAADAARRAA